MAADLTFKARNLALAMSASAEKLIAAFDEFENHLKEKEGSGITWADHSLMLEGDTQLQHITADMLNNAHSNAESIYSAMKVAFQDDVFQALRL